MTVVTTDEAQCHRRRRDRRRRPRPAAEGRGAAGMDARGPRGPRRPGLPRPAHRRRHAGGVQQAAGPGGDLRLRGAPRDLPGHARPGQEPGGRLPAGHLRLAHRRLHRRRPDHGHPAQLPTPWPSRAARPSSPAPTPPTTTSPTRRRSATGSLRVVHTIEASQRLLQQRSLARGAGHVAVAARRRSTRWCGRTIRAGARWCSAPPPPTWSAWTPTRAGPCWTTCSPGRPPRTGLPARVVGRGHGDLGQPRRAAPGLPLRRRLAPGHAPHDPARRRADPVSIDRMAIVTGGGSGHRAGHQRAAGGRRQRRRHLRPGRRRRRSRGRPRSWPPAARPSA